MTISEKTELEIPNSPSPEPLPFFLRISWTLFQANSWVRYLRAFCACGSFQAILSNNSKDFRCPSPARIKAAPFQLADI